MLQTPFEAFFDALERGKEMPLTTLEISVKTHEVIFAADRSAREGWAVKLWLAQSKTWRMA